MTCKWMWLYSEKDNMEDEEKNKQWVLTLFERNDTLPPQRAQNLVWQ